MYKLSYYLQTNLFCVLILLLILIGLRNKTRYSVLLFKKILFCSILFCMFDIVSVIFRGTNYNSSNLILTFSNSFYLFLPLLIGYYWIQYVYLTIDENRFKLKKVKFLLVIPLLLGFIMLMINVFSHNIFIINSNNIYERSNMYFLYAISSWIYMAISSIKTIIVYHRTDNIYIKEKIFPLSLFIVAPLITSIVQLLFYGLSVSQIGFTVSSLLIFLYYQDEQILMDNLTKVNNRTSFNEFLQNKYDVLKDNDIISLVFIDIDNFKYINDNYGHLVGDEVLINVASILKKSCLEFNKNLFLARYGGDEFVIVSSLNLKQINELEKLIDNNVKVYNKEENIKISISKGYTSDIKANYKSIIHIIDIADDLMYKNKKTKKSNKLFSE